MVGYYGWQGRHFAPDAINPQASAICSRCGFKFPLDSMTWQYDFRGGPTVENTRILVCGRSSCLDVPNPQISPSILSPDPPMLFNARPEPYAVDETNWLVTDDGSILTTDDGTEFITSNPNPASSPATAKLTTRLLYPGGTVTSVYLDLFDGNPTGSGRSILQAVTGSPVRSDIGTTLTITNGVALNTNVYSVTMASLTTVNVSYAGLYDAASGGVLLTRAPVSSSPSITSGQAVVFEALALSINLNT